MRISILSLFAGIFLLTSCQETIDGNGNYVKENRILEDFTEVQVAGVFQVILKEGDPGIEIDGDENLIPHIITSVTGSKLKVDTEDKYLNSDHLVLTIFYDDIEEFTLSGAGEVKTDGKLNANDFHFSLNGAGNAELELDVDDFELNLNGGGEIVLFGKADEASYEISGAGEVKAFELKTNSASVDVAGAGDLELYVVEELDVDVSGAGDVVYMGSPKVSQSISGAGSITQKSK